MTAIAPVGVYANKYQPLQPGDSFHPYTKMRFADGATGNDSNDGQSPLTPWKTMTFTAASTPQGCAVMVAPGTYAENWTWTVPNVDIVGWGGRSGIVNFTGNVTINHAISSVRLRNVSLVNSVIVMAAGATYFEAAQINSLTKSGAAYVEDVNSDIATLSVTGAGLVALHGGKYGDITVNSANAILNISNALAINATTALAVIAGIFRATHTTITVGSPQMFAINAGGTSVVALSNVSCIDSNQTPTPINLGGTYSLDDVIFNVGNSTLSASSLGFSTYSDGLYANSIRSTTGYTALTDTTQSRTGKIGEVLQTGAVNASVANGTINSPVTLGSITLNKGIWIVSGWGALTASDQSLFAFQVNLDPSASIANFGCWTGQGQQDLVPQTVVTGPNYYPITADNTVINLQAGRDGGGSTPTVRWNITAWRIA